MVMKVLSMVSVLEKMANQNNWICKCSDWMFLGNSYSLWPKGSLIASYAMVGYKKMLNLNFWPQWCLMCHLQCWNVMTISQGDNY